MFHSTCFGRSRILTLPFPCCHAALLGSSGDIPLPSERRILACHMHPDHISTTVQLIERLWLACCDCQRSDPASGGAKRQYALLHIFYQSKVLAYSPSGVRTASYLVTASTASTHISRPFFRMLVNLSTY